MAIDPVIIDFAARGVADVMRAFEQIEGRLAQAERGGTTVTKREASERARTTRSEVESRKRAYDKLARDVAKDQERASRESDRLHQRSSEMAGRFAAKQANLEIREAERAARAVEKLEEWKMRVRIRSSEMAGRFAAAEARKEAALQGRVNHAGVSGLSRGASHGMRLAGMAAGGLALGGGFAVADAVRKQLSAEKSAALLVNTVTTGAKPPEGASVSNILGQASAISATTGLTKDELIGSALSYAQHAKGGDFKGAMANMGFFAKMSQVTGADINELAANAGTLQSQNPNLDAKAMQQMLLDVNAQSKMGSMSMADVAKQMGTLGSTRSAFKGDMARNQRELFALGQIVAPGGDVAEAGIFTKDFAQEAVKGGKKHKALVAAGVKFDEKSGQLAMSPGEVLAQVIAGTGGNITKLNDMFEGRGGKLPGELIGTYHGAGGGKAGLAAVQQSIAAITTATMTPEQLEAQHQQTMSTPAMRLQAAFEKLETQIGDALEPALSKLADKAPQLAETLGKVAEAGVEVLTWLADNKWQGLAAIVAGSIAKEIATAQLGAILAKGVQGSLSGQLAGGLAIASAAFTIAEVGMMAIDHIANEDVKKQKAEVAGDIGAWNTAAEIDEKRRSGKLTPQDIKGAEAQLDQAKSRAADAGPDKAMSIFDPREGLRELKDLISGGKRSEEDTRAQKNAQDAANRLKKALDDAAKSAHAFAAAAGTVKSTAPAGPIGQGPR